MKKIIIVFAVILIVVVAFNFLSSPDPVSTEENDSAEKGFSIRKSFKNILPGDNEQTPAQKLGRHEEGENVVVINSGTHQMDVEEAEERIEDLKEMKEEAMDFARWTLFSENAKFSPEEKEKLLDKAMEVFKEQEKQVLLRDVIFEGTEKTLHDKAISVLAQNMDKEQLEAFVTEVVRRKPAPPGKAAVIEFAATRNIYVK